MKNNFRLDSANEMDHRLGRILGDDFTIASGKSEAERINVLPKIDLPGPLTVVKNLGQGNLPQKRRRYNFKVQFSTIILSLFTTN